MLTGRDGSRLPDFLVVGAAKSGTTSLYRYLAEHPHIYFPKDKEPNYFSFAQAPWAAGCGEHAFRDKNNIQDYSRYCALFFEARPNELIGEASVTYLPLCRETVKQIYLDYEDPRKLKIIIMLRNPVDRAVSQYIQRRQAGQEDLSLGDAISRSTINKRLEAGYQVTWDYLSLGRYAEAVRHYIECFEQVKIIEFSGFVNNTLEIVSEVCEFLGVKACDTLNLTVVHNQSGVDANWLTAFINALVYRPNPIRSAIARIVPDDLKPYVLAKYAKIGLKKWSPPDDLVESLQNYYEEDQRLLKRYLSEMDRLAD